MCVCMCVACIHRSFLVFLNINLSVENENINVLLQSVGKAYMELERINHLLVVNIY